MHQPTRDRFPGLNDGWIVGRHDPPGAPPTIQNTRLANEHGDIQTQASHRRRNDYLSNRVFPETEITFDTRPHDFGESRNMSHPGFAFPCPPLPATLGPPHSLGIEAHYQESTPKDGQEARGIIPRVTQSTADPNGGTSSTAVPLEVEGHIQDHTVWGHHRDGQTTFANTMSSVPHAVQHGLGGTMVLRQLQIEYRPIPARPCPPMYDTLTIHGNVGPSFGNGPHQNSVASGHYVLDPYMSHHNNLEPNPYPTGNHNPPRGGSNEGTINSLGHLGHRATGDGDPTNASNDPLRAWRSRIGGNPNEAAGLVVSVPTAPAPGPFKITQVLYECNSRQIGWSRQPPIEFGWVKLVDATNSRHIDFPGINDRVLIYEGVGSTISCRLEFPDGVYIRWKISTTNHKSNPESITKKKLAFEIAKCVKRGIETIKAQEGYSSVTFENLVLTKLLHVSRASWQPELWHEPATPAHSPS